MSENDIHKLPSLKPILTVFVILLCVTLLNVVLSKFMAGPLGLAVTMGLATVNGVLMLAVFMGLWWDKRFHTVAIIATALFLSLFFLFTMADVATRSYLDPREGSAFDIKSPVKPISDHSDGVRH